MAGFKSERAAGFKSECMAGFIGIRILAMMGRQFQPLKFEQVIILEGAEGTGKSSCFAFLVDGSDHAHYHFGAAPSADDDSRKIGEALRRKVVCEWGELDKWNKDCHEGNKKFISEPLVRYRKSYAAGDAQDYPIRCIFVGTTNEIEGEYLPQGDNRRYHPIIVPGDRSNPALRRDDLLADRIQILAQLKHIWDNHPPASLMLPGEYVDVQRKVTERRAKTPPFLAKIQEYLDLNYKAGNSITTERIMSEGLYIKAQEHVRYRTQVAGALKTLGFTQTPKKPNQPRYWVNPNFVDSTTRARKEIKAGRLLQ